MDAFVAINGSRGYFYPQTVWGGGEVSRLAIEMLCLLSLIGLDKRC
jgi:hypothetical protein